MRRSGSSPTSCFTNETASWIVSFLPRDGDQADQSFAVVAGREVGVLEHDVRERPRELLGPLLGHSDPGGERRPGTAHSLAVDVFGLLGEPMDRANRSRSWRAMKTTDSENTRVSTVQCSS